MKRLCGCLGLVVVLSLAAAGAAHSAIAADPGVTTRIAWKGCGKRLQCARVRVPLDWARPGLGTISLAVVRQLASRPGQRIGSLFVNYGGPGVAGVPAVKAGGADLDKLGHGRFDVVGWDPRGTGVRRRPPGRRPAGQRQAADPRRLRPYQRRGPEPLRRSSTQRVSDPARLRTTANLPRGPTAV